MCVHYSELDSFPGVKEFSNVTGNDSNTYDFLNVVELKA